MKLHCIYLILLNFMYQAEQILDPKSNVLILKGKDTKTTCKNYGWRDFRVFAPFLWNDFPAFIRQTESIDNFKKRLKTYLFIRHFR